MSEPQTFASHRRFDPPYHFFLAPVALIALGAAAYYLFRYPSLHHGLVLIGVAALFVAVIKLRTYAIRVQDRLIRLEETIRMQRLLPAELQDRIHELTPSQMVGLRFASDAELVDRVRQVLDQGLSGEAIKKHILSWRPDTFRV